MAIESGESGSTQNQALNAILFLYREVLRKEIGYTLNFFLSEPLPR